MRLHLQRNLRVQGRRLEEAEVDHREAFRHRALRGIRVQEAVLQVLVEEVVVVLPEERAEAEVLPGHSRHTRRNDDGGCQRTRRSPNSKMICLVAEW